MSPTKPTPLPPDAGSRYPAIEGFIERATEQDIPPLFGGVRQALIDLKGPKALHSKKVIAALDRVEELLHSLLKTREKLSQELKPRR